MKRRAFLQGALRAATTIAGAATLLMPLKREAVAALSVPAAPRLLVDPKAEAWARTYKHKTWALGIEISTKAMKDDVCGLYQQRGQRLRSGQTEHDRLATEDVFGTL